VVNLVADVQFDPAHDLLVGRGVWVHVQDRERVGLVYEARVARRASINVTIIEVRAQSS
jgi:hypothetical protein